MSRPAAGAGGVRRIIGGRDLLCGTVTGEHGVGRLKRGAVHELSPIVLDCSGAVKRALDPEGILNPGKIFE